MTGILDRLVRVRFLLLLAPIVVLLVASPAGGDGLGQGSTAIALGSLALFCLSLGLNLAGYDPDAPAIASKLSEDPAGQALLERWLRRSKRFRFVGGAAGFVISLGVLADGNLFQILLFVLLGIAVGGGLAEIHVFRRRSGGSRLADLAVRHVADYTTRTDRWALIAIAVFAIALAVVSLVASAEARGFVVFSSLAALLVAAVAGALQRLVVVRPRPALPDALRSADDLLRRLAATRGFTRPAIALGAGLLAQALGRLGTDVAIAAAVLFAIASLAWYVSSRQSQIRPAVAIQ